MFVMAIKHTVQDYAAWKAVYDSYPPTHGGAKFARVNRATDHPNDVLIVTGWDREEDADAFHANPKLKDVMISAGVIGAPRFETYEQVEVLNG